ncbi:transposase [Pseudoalteromonas piscicida]|uniref:Transposase n=1 Tax=Pseudoalteromonas piscicida TaxID=43662 RepID=A0AAQ2EQK4_PSEO7|nr:MULTISPECIES: transposase [Pseudoalteromonas]KJY87704.1 transposase [Pseudoalteromonas piscicida]TMN33326.1 transposase [Pseudoalteromonas piscicida]TMN39111.1 transposase [Pseudoalteromonas piscicida]TMN52386.1 transposase [Pseudoalteromonas piscicida]TMN54350.1 transposase [Pseudoalteromonas piscicida]
MQYRRNYVAGGTYFFTVNLLERKKTLLVDHINELREAVRWVKSHYPFEINAWVVLPDHIHAVLILPDGDSDYSNRWREIKKRFSKSLPATERVSASRQHKNERGIWQRRFWEHTIKDENDYWHHVNYVHYNPLKHGLVTRVQDWPYSSFHRAVQYGIYPQNWCGE